MSEENSVEIIKQENAIEIISKMTPEQLFKDGSLTPLIEAVREEVSKIKPDITTAKGRKEIASTAYKVAQTKTLVDSMGKKLGEELREKLSLINDERSAAKKSFEEIQAEVRKPLDEWEKAEEIRVKNIELKISEIKQVANDLQNIPMDILEQKLNFLRTIDFDFEDKADTAESEKAKAMLKVRDAIDERRIYDADQEKKRLEKIEEDRLKAEKERIEREKKIAEEAAEKARLDAEKKFKEEAEVAQAKADAEIKRIADEKAKSEKDAAEAQAKAEREAQQAKERAEKAERDAAEAKQRADKAAQDAKEKAERDQKEKARQEALELERRENNKKIAAAVHSRIVKHLMENCALTKEQSVAVVKEIASKNVVGVSITY